MKRLIYALILLLLAACNKDKTISTNADITIGISARYQTKLTFDGTALSFTSGDNVELFIEGVNSAILSNASTGNVGTFKGSLIRKGVSKENCKWYVIYPQKQTISSSGIISANCPSTQTAPFNKSSCLMFSDVKSADYDEENIPGLSFSMNHALGIIKISIENSSDEYKDEIIKAIRLNGNSILTGDYTLDVHQISPNEHQISPKPQFSSQGNKYVVSSFNDSRILGKGVVHTVYLYVNPTTIGDLSISVVGTNHVFTKSSSSTVTIKQGSINSFPTFDLKDFTVKDVGSSIKSVACWGDSYTNAGYSSYPNNLKELLGANWVVYNGGISGDRVDEIAARQGGLSIVTNEEFVLPAKGSVNTKGILRTRNNACEEGYFPMRRYSGAMSNPCLVMGVPCKIISTSSIPPGKDIDDPSATFSATYTRLEDGDPIIVPAHTPIVSQGAQTTKNANLQVIYMGANGRVVYNGKLGSDNYFDNLVNYHRYMIEFNTNQSDYLVLGYHNSHWSQPYWERFSKEFGNDRTIDLRRIVPARGRELIVRTGAYPDLASIPDSELQRIDDGKWPLCFQHTETDTHPSEYGARAIAILISANFYN